MYDELIKDLREIGGNRAIPIRMAETAKEAADAIEVQQKLLDGLEADNDSLCEKIEELQAYVALYKDGGETAMKVANDYKARDEELPAIREEQGAQIIAMAAEDKPRWIPVTEEPPLKVGDDGYNGYLVYANGYYEVADYTTDKFDNVPYFHVNGEYEPDVTHYMPLPEPPKEE